ncbi:Uma2 family endonuclease [Leptolyngbya sp. AN02str]|uniref:Uma2 family endonuclease n=1 Tax=Leptolyngbya sp. AN02str TaxID=3423363 RepID=UPI003D31D8CF
MAPPLLVVKVVSPGDLQRDRDYIAKRMQYQDVGIPEYWIVDPQVGAVVVLSLGEAGYVEAGSFAGQEPVRSPQFGTLDLTADQVFAAAETAE